MLKNVFLLSGMWGMGLGASFVQIPSAQNVLVEKGYSSISTVPLGLIMLLSSPCAILIPKMSTRYGEKKTFLTASVLGIGGSLLQMTGVLMSGDAETLSPAELFLILVGASFQSFTYASANNLRFAVAYFSTREFLPKATALVLFGGVISSLLGPLLSNVTRYMIPQSEYAGNFGQIAILYFVFGFLAALTDFEPPIKNQSSVEDVLKETVNMVLTDTDRGQRAIDIASEVEDSDTTSERTFSEILKETDLALLTFFQCLSYSIMALYMTQVQLPMIALGYSANARTYTITSHMLGMFLPGLISGHIINCIGTWTTTFLGFIVLLLGGVIFLVNNSLTMFIVGMTAVGIGWNLSFVGPSAEVSKIYTPKEKDKVIGFNDGIMLLSIGIFALSGSAIYEAIRSWKYFNIMLMCCSGSSSLLAAWREVKYRLQPLIERGPRALSETFSFDQQLLDSL